MSTPAPQARLAVFLDRDGTLIADRHYLGDPAGVELLPGAAPAVARLNRAGLTVVLATNQSGIGRGYFTEADFQAVQHRIAALLASSGARLDAVYHCPHAPDDTPACECRKPRTGLFRRAAEELGLDLAASYYIGDRVRDVRPALELGGTGILVAERPEELAALPAGLHAAADLPEAAERVLSGTFRD